MLVKAGVGQADAEVVVDVGALGGICGEGKALVGEAVGEGGDANVEVDVPMVGQVGFDGFEDGQVDARQMCQGGECGAAGL